MAFASTTEWEVRTTGSNSNGGGFNTSATGTDYSQQDSPQFSYTDLVIDATTNTKITSAAHPFDSASPGNIINVTGGTGFTVQRIQIVSVASGVATCDKAVGTLGSTGGTGNLGGGLVDPSVVMTASMVQGNTVWLKNGTPYVITAQLTLKGQLIGYGTVHGDNGIPNISTATSSIAMLGVSGVSLVKNILFTNTAASPSICIFPNSATVTITNCSLSGCLHGIDSVGTSNVFVSNSSIIGMSGSAILGGSNVTLVNSYISGCTGTQVAVSGATLLKIAHSIIAGGGGVGIQINPAGTVMIVNSTLANHGSSAVFSGIGYTGSLQMQSAIIYGNGNVGLRLTGTPAKYWPYVANNAWGNNTGGDYSTGLPAGAGDVTLTADPFTNAAGGDFSLNSTAGGGAACKGVGFPGAFPGGTTTGHLDVGAVQSGTGGGGGGILFNQGMDGGF